MSPLFLVSAFGAAMVVAVLVRPLVPSIVLATLAALIVAVAGPLATGGGINAAAATAVGALLGAPILGAIARWRR